MQNDFYDYASNNDFNDYSNKLNIPQMKSLICIGIGWIGISIVATIVSLILSLFYPSSEEMTPLQNVTLTGYVNFTSYAIIFISLLAVLGLPIIKKILSQFTNLEKIGKGFMYGGILLVSSIAYNMIVLIIYPQFSSNQNQNLVVEMIRTMPVISFFSVVLFAPITEEITYRLCLTGTLAKRSKMFAIITSSVIFGLIHSAFIDLSFINMNQQELINEIIALPSYIISGVIMALAYTKEDSIATSIVAHATNNFIAFLQSFMVVEELFRLF